MSELLAQVLDGVSVAELQAMIDRKLNRANKADLEKLPKHDSRRRLEKLATPRRCLVVDECSWAEMNTVVDYMYSGPTPPYLSPMAPEVAADAEFQKEASQSINENTVLDNGQPNAAQADRNAALQSVLLELDHKDDEHWTPNRQPSLGAVAALLAKVGQSPASRAELLSADEHFVRDADHAKASEDRIAEAAAVKAPGDAMAERLAAAGDAQREGVMGTPGAKPAATPPKPATSKAAKKAAKKARKAAAKKAAKKNE